MAGTKAGAAKAKATVIKNHGKDFYKAIGSKGGQATGMKGFALDPKRARTAGRKGGQHRAGYRKPLNEPVQLPKIYKVKNINFSGDYDKPVNVSKPSDKIKIVSPSLHKLTWWKKK